MRAMMLDAYCTGGSTSIITLSDSTLSLKAGDNFFVNGKRRVVENGMLVPVPGNRAERRRTEAIARKPKH